MWRWTLHEHGDGRWLPFLPEPFTWSTSTWYQSI